MMRLFFLLTLLSVLATAFFGAYAWKWYQTEFPNVGILNSQYPLVHYEGPNLPFTVTIQKGRPANWANLSEISKLAIDAIVVSEDWAFYQHQGYDPKQMREAIQEDWEEKGFARGASTITQQVVRNVFLTQDKNLWRKLKELYLAVRLEKATNKRKILEAYLNIAEWGEGIFGIRAASRFYFGKEPAALTAKEGAFLAMLLPSPKRYSQSFRKKALTDYASETIDDILTKMTQAHYLTQAERAAEAGVRLSFEKPPESQSASGSSDEALSPEITPTPSPEPESL